MSRSWILPVTLAGLAALVVAAIGGTITDLGPWYQGLEKPDWTPPRLAFPIAWTTVFALTVISFVTAWRNAPSTKASDTLIGLFAANAFLNILWSLLFFRVQRPDWAFYELIVLWVSILAMMIYCWRLSRMASVLLLPYIAWVSAAGLLNWQIVQLNGPFG
ncbi:TspO/MBR family protein [Aurantiacibacter sediminis]|uniref:Tryptophan-rich sensory protein n=1 Tax=Aurantiacibacter sediminis TaxID=2793064 RepID=A0ABS0N1Z3_9SPHN|nr:TspO/MBR family protein [Aurantiacibacter sediminis]MBH5321979.1 tryptophan-rich sensory protein [Aurantiacibacter sediminis]